MPQRTNVYSISEVSQDVDFRFSLQTYKGVRNTKNWRKKSRWSKGNQDDPKRLSFKNPKLNIENIEKNITVNLKSSREVLSLISEAAEERTKNWKIKPTHHPEWSSERGKEGKWNGMECNMQTRKRNSNTQVMSIPQRNTETRRKQHIWRDNGWESKLVKARTLCL